MDKDTRSAFEALGKEREPGLFGELIAMVGQNKKYWLLPLLVVLLIFGILLVLGSTAAGPFIYTLF